MIKLTNSTIKRVLILFGALDFLTVIKNYNNIYRLVFPSRDFYWMDAVSIMIYISLLASGYFLVRQSKVGIWISYFQFPLRLAFAFFSFGFLMILNRVIGDQKLAIWILSGFLFILEIGRLVLTIMIHKKLNNKK